MLEDQGFMDAAALKESKSGVRRGDDLQNRSVLFFENIDEQ